MLIPLQVRMSWAGARQPRVCWVEGAEHLHMARVDGLCSDDSQGGQVGKCNPHQGAALVRQLQAHGQWVGCLWMVVRLW